MKAKVFFKSSNVNEQLPSLGVAGAAPAVVAALDPDPFDPVFAKPIFLFGPKLDGSLKLGQQLLQ